jgi:bifunctional DNase/RNase
MRKKQKYRISNNLPVFILVIVLLAFIGIAVLTFTPQVDTDQFIEITTIRVEGDSLIIAHNCTGIIAGTSPERLESIALGLENKVDVRPTTHENFVALLNAFNITLDRVEIYRFEDDIFYSDAYFHSKDNMLQLDMRPSDAIALAVRTKSPVYVNKSIFLAMGKNICAVS